MEPSGLRRKRLKCESFRRASDKFVDISVLRFGYVDIVDGNFLRMTNLYEMLRTLSSCADRRRSQEVFYSDCISQSKQKGIWHASRFTLNEIGNLPKITKVVFAEKKVFLTTSQDYV